MESSEALQQFNRMYRERRLKALALRQPFPGYAEACGRLQQAMSLAKGGIVDPAAFWNFVFEPVDKKSSNRTTALDVSKETKA